MGLFKKNCLAVVATDGTPAAGFTRQNVDGTYREAAGIYWFWWRAGNQPSLATHEVTVQPVSDAARVATLNANALVAPPVGAAAPAGAVGMRVNVFTDAGVAVDSILRFSARPL